MLDRRAEEMFAAVTPYRFDRKTTIPIVLRAPCPPCLRGFLPWRIRTSATEPAEEALVRSPRIERGENLAWLLHLNDISTAQLAPAVTTPRSTVRLCVFCRTGNAN